MNTQTKTAAAAPGATAALQGQFLTFRTAGEDFAAGILRVREIVPWTVVTRVPGTPPWIRGVVNLRGSVVPVLDLGLRFGTGESAVTRATCIIIIEVQQGGEQTAMGVMADAVHQVVDLAPGDIEPPPSFGLRVRLDYLLGVGKVGGRFVLVLNVDRVLSTEELLAVSSLELPEGEKTEQAAS